MPSPRLFIITPDLADLSDWPARLGHICAAGDAAAVAVRLADGPERDLVARAKLLAGPLQDAGVAVLVVDRPDIVGRAGLDGCHFTDIGLMAEPLESLKGQDRIVGVGGLRARHDAMEAAEGGADYVMFGEPKADGFTPPLDAIVERAEWWAEVFQTPCVAYAPGIEAVEALAGTGVDFIAIGAWIFEAADGLEQAVRARDALRAAKVRE